jgi:multidrug resistance efflux pump
LAVAVAVAAILFIVLVFFVPISDTVGGSAEVVQRQKHVAFSKIEGLIERVLVKEGDTVAEGDVLAALEPKEIDFKIQKAKTDFEVLTEELLLMRAVADQESQKLAESKLVELKRKAAWLDMNFYKWQSEFLEIKAPVSGVIATKDVQSLAGKKLTPGEAFCEIVVPTELWAEVSVPEDRVANVRPKQPLWLYLNNDPLESHSLIVEEISPASEANDRRGNLFRVKGPFPAGERTAKVGMKGTGKIDTGDKTLWFLVTRRLVKVWNEFALRFY